MKIPEDKKYNISGQALLATLCFLLVCILTYACWPTTAQDQNHEITRPYTGKINTTISAYGSLQPKVRHSIISMVSGNIEQIHLRPGNVAKVGDIIMSLSNPKLVRAAEKAELEWLAEKANLEKLKATQLKQLSELRSQEKIANFELKIADSRLKARKILYGQQIVSALELQQAELEYAKSEQALFDQKQALKTLYITQKAELQAHQFVLTKARKEVELLKQDIEHLKIKASIDGVITKLNTDLDEGQFIEEGQSLGQLADPKSLYALVRVQAGDIAMLANGQPVSISLREHKVHGYVSRISPQVDNSTVEVDVAIEAALPDSAISNVSISASINVSSDQDTLLVNKPPHIQHSGINQLVVTEDNSASYRIRQVQIGWLGDEQMQVLHGLTSRDYVVMLDPAKIRETSDD